MFNDSTIIKYYVRQTKYLRLKTTSNWKFVFIPSRRSLSFRHSVCHLARCSIGLSFIKLLISSKMHNLHQQIFSHEHYEVSLQVLLAPKFCLPPKFESPASHTLSHHRKQFYWTEHRKKKKLPLQFCFKHFKFCEEQRDMSLHHKNGRRRRFEEKFLHDVATVYPLPIKLSASPL